MNTLTSSSFLHSLYSLQNPNFTKTISQTTTLSFRYKNTSFKTLNFKLNYKLPSSSQVSDTEEDEYEDDDEEEPADEYEGVVVDEFEDEDEDDDVEDEEGEDEENVVVVVGESKSGFEEFKWQRIERIRNDVREYGDGIIDVDELASVYNFRIDKFQRSAIQAFLRGSSVVVSAPTSAGKTLIAEAAAVATVARGKRLFYTTPLKALSNQKFREFCDAFGEDNVGLLTGDSAINRDAPVLIMTTEILRNMLYQRGYQENLDTISTTVKNIQWPHYNVEVVGTYK